MDASAGAPDGGTAPRQPDAAAPRDAAAEPPESDESARLFDLTRVLDVAVTMEPADFAQLRSEGRSLVAVRGQGSKIRGRFEGKLVLIPPG